MPTLDSRRLTSNLRYLKIIGDDTKAIDSVLTADVWRDHLLKEEAILNAKLSELEKEGDDKRFVDAREEAETRLADVHARLSDMEAASGPARAAALLAGEPYQRPSARSLVILNPSINRFRFQRGGSAEANKVL